MGLLGLASGYAGVPPGAMLSDVAPEDGTGSAVGVFRFAGDLGLMLAPAVAGLSVAWVGFRGAFAIGAVPVVIALVMAGRTAETLKRAEPPVSAG
jgi:MFS family permease